MSEGWLLVGEGDSMVVRWTADLDTPTKSNVQTKPGTNNG